MTGNSHRYYCRLLKLSFYENGNPNKTLNVEIQRLLLHSSRVETEITKEPATRL